uniref:Uncharacterized protein n=1 Tax=Tanacetum cinerariifolium TaxID=118510 RepID=A0A6L2K0A0_TANCI|nr:hypothetical protein [Tanacetum cinerariifolium]
MIAFDSSTRVKPKVRMKSDIGFGVDAAMDIKEKHQVFTAASEDISVARQKVDAVGYCCQIVLLRRMMLLSQVKTVSAKCCCSMKKYSKYLMLLEQ